MKKKIQASHWLTINPGVR
uniref:Uncharacterized protein n=1 Tax=Anguilla anguilla TaxID=7936 RepID=A0A0E9RT10_ANGAN